MKCVQFQKMYKLVLREIQFTKKSRRFPVVLFAVILEIAAVDVEKIGAIRLASCVFS